MEPSRNTQPMGAEYAPALPPVVPEVVPGEVAPQSTPEALPVVGEREQVPRAPVVQTVDPAMVALPQAPAPVAPVVPTTPQDDTSPVLAADEDLIEKEWVDQAKKIIAETANDPHKREEAVARLQRDYLRKRYGKEIGNA